MGAIICAIEATPEADEALRAAVRLSRDARLRLVLVHVEESAGTDPAGRSAAQRRGRQLLERAAASQGVEGEADLRVELGEPARSLARVAAEEAASVIVLGSRRLHWWQRRPVSGLSAVLAATAPCPVAVVPQPARR